MNFSTGVGSAWNIFSSELQNDGFDIFNASEGNANSASREGETASNASSSSLDIAERVEELILSCIPVKKAEDSKNDNDSKEKEKQLKEPLIPKNAAEEMARTIILPCGPATGGGAPDQTNEENPSGNVRATAQQNQNEQPAQPLPETSPAQGRNDANIDPAFLEALPEDLRQEVLSENGPWDLGAHVGPRGPIAGQP